jgi:hypothetical protein
VKNEHSQCSTARGRVFYDCIALTSRLLVWVRSARISDSRPVSRSTGKDDLSEITIEVERNGGTPVARIEDSGCEFDPAQVPAPSLASSLEGAKVRGFGIHLMRIFATGMNYERRDGRNRLTLRFAGPN